MPVPERQALDAYALASATNGKAGRLVAPATPGFCGVYLSGFVSSARRRQVVPPAASYAHYALASYAHYALACSQRRYFAAKTARPGESLQTYPALLCMSFELRFLGPVSGQSVPVYVCTYAASCPHYAFNNSARRRSQRVGA